MVVIAIVPIGALPYPCRNSWGGRAWQKRVTVEGLRKDHRGWCSPQSPPEPSLLKEWGLSIGLGRFASLRAVWGSSTLSAGRSTSYSSPIGGDNACCAGGSTSADVAWEGERGLDCDCDSHDNAKTSTSTTINTNTNTKHQRQH